MSKEVFESIMTGLKEAIAWSRGEIELPYTEYYPRQSDGTTPPKRRVVGSNPAGGTKNTS